MTTVVYIAFSDESTYNLDLDSISYFLRNYLPTVRVFNRMNNELLATRIMRIFPSRLFLCCLLGSVSGQTLCELICSATSFYCNTAN